MATERFSPGSSDREEKDESGQHLGRGRYPGQPTLAIGDADRGRLDVRPLPDGPLALAAAQVEPPDLILLDRKMPDMDGASCRTLAPRSASC